jgi:hydrogenase maturation protease
VLVGGVGYRNLRDGSLGPYLADELAGRAPDGVEVEDLSYHPVGFHQNLLDRPPYDRLVLVSAISRERREPGAITSYRWDGELPSRDEIQERVNEAVTGVISLDNLLIVCTAFGGMPEDTRVIEVQPADEGWGEGFSPAIEARLEEIEEAIWSSTRP